MTFVADESVDRQIVEAVRSLGYQVLSVAQTSPGVADEAVLRLANGASSVLLTADKDFGELVFRQQRVHSGILLYRLAGFAPIVKARIITDAIRKHSHEMEDAFCVVTDATVRIRKPRPQ